MSTTTVYQVKTAMDYEGDWVLGTFMTFNEAMALAAAHKPETHEDSMYLLEFPVGAGKGRVVASWRQRDRGTWSLGHINQANFKEQTWHEAQAAGPCGSS